MGRLGPLEWVLNTPSHHRVHHGRNPKYIDRNHAGSLIVWDRMFGTFKEEEEEPVYGITTPLANWNPVWANLHYWAELLHMARRAARPARPLADLLEAAGLAAFRPRRLRARSRGGRGPLPQVRPRGETTHASLRPHPVRGRQPGDIACSCKHEATLPAATRIAAAAFIFASAAALGGLLDHRGWARGLELLRLLCLAASGFWLLPFVLAGALAVLAILSMAWLAWLRESADPSTPSPSAA